MFNWGVDVNEGFEVAFFYNKVSKITINNFTPSEDNNA